ncbi:hypothetical protein [Roseibium sp.]|uniref:hypothetical protein n=1 Tax=Roseibium sp. TaxID=1936156 RepID=UPI00391C53E2
MTKPTGKNQYAKITCGSDTQHPLDIEAKISIDGLPYVLVSSCTTTSVLRRVDRPRFYAEFTGAELQDLITCGLLIQDRDAFSCIELGLQHDHEIKLWHLDDEIADLVVFRRYFCDEFLSMELNGLTTRSDPAMKVAIGHIFANWFRRPANLERSGNRFRGPPTVQAFTRPPPSTLRAWLRKYKASGFKAMALCPLRHKRIIWSRSPHSLKDFPTLKSAMQSNLKGKSS